jgi:nicotinamidase-related amidase
MQNDFFYPDGSFAHIAQQHPKAMIDIPFLVGTIPNVGRPASAFRAAGKPVVYVAHVFKRDYSDAAFPFWRLGLTGTRSRQPHALCRRLVGSEVVDELKPHEGSTWSSRKALAASTRRPMIPFFGTRASPPLLPWASPRASACPTLRVAASNIITE